VLEFLVVLDHRALVPIFFEGHYRLASTLS